MSVALRVLLQSFLAIAAIVAMAIWIYISLSPVVIASSYIKDHIFPSLNESQALEGDILRHRVRLLTYVISKDIDDLNKAGESERQIESHLEKYKSLITEKKDEELYSLVMRGFDGYKKESSKLVELVRSNAEMTVLEQFAKNDYRNAAENFRVAGESLANFNLNMGVDFIDKNSQDIDELITTLVYYCVAILIVISLFNAYVYQSISFAMRRLFSPGRCNRQSR